MTPSRPPAEARADERADERAAARATALDKEPAATSDSAPPPPPLPAAPHRSALHSTQELRAALAPLLARHSALTAPLIAAAAGACAGLLLWRAGEQDAYAPPLLALGLWVLWRLPAGRLRRATRKLMSALYALGGAALLWERSGAHRVWEAGTDEWGYAPESLTLKLCAALFALSWLTSLRLTPAPAAPRPSPAPPHTPEVTQ